MRSHCTKVFAKKVPEKDMRDSFALIQDKYTTSTEKVLDNMSAYAKKNILAVPANIVLPEDRVYLTKPTYTGDQMSEDLKAGFIFWPFPPPKDFLPTVPRIDSDTRQTITNILGIHSKFVECFKKGK